MRIRPTVGVLLLVFGLALTLGTSEGFAAAARAAAPAARQGAAGSGDLLHQLQGFLVSLWSPAGCRIDPLGRCLPNTNTTTATPRPPGPDAGCRLDPWGGCISIP